MRVRNQEASLGNSTSISWAASARRLKDRTILALNGLGWVESDRAALSDVPLVSGRWEKRRFRNVGRRRRI